MKKRETTDVEYSRKILEDYAKNVENQPPKVSLYLEKIIGENPIKVMDNKEILPEKPQKVILMFPGITPDIPFQYGGRVKNSKTKKIYGLESMDDLGYYFSNESKNRVIEFGYPKDGDFDIDKYYLLIKEYLQKNGVDKSLPIEIFGLSMGGKVTTLLAAKLIKDGYKVDTLNLYAPSLDINSLKGGNIIEKLPLFLPAAVWKYITGPMLHFLVWKSGQLKLDFSKLKQFKLPIKIEKDWWVEGKRPDISRLAKAVANYDVSYHQIKSRLAFIFKKLDEYNDLLKELKKVKKVNLILSYFPNFAAGTDGTINNTNVIKQIMKIFPGAEIKIIGLEGLPHGQLPQSNRLHEKIFKENGID